MASFGDRCKYCDQQYRCDNCKELQRNCVCSSCYNERCRERDEARRVARACWRAEPDEGVPLSIHEEVGKGGMAWLTEEGPEDVAARKAKEVADHAMMVRVFNHPYLREE